MNKFNIYFALKKKKNHWLRIIELFKRSDFLELDLYKTVDFHKRSILTA